MLVVVEDGDGQQLFERFFYVETLRRFDVFQIDAAKGGRHRRDDADEFVRIFNVELHVEHVDVGKPFEQHTLALHDRLGSQRTPVAKAQDGGAVAYHGHQIPLGGVFVGQIGRFLNLEHGHGNPGRVRQAEIALGEQGFGGRYRDLAGPPVQFVILQCIFVGDCRRH